MSMDEKRSESLVENKTESPKASSSNSNQEEAVATLQDHAASAMADSLDAPILSKSQMKKIKRWERKMEIKQRRKQQEKEVRHARAKAQGRDLEAERRLLQERTQDGSSKRRRIEQFQKDKLPLAQASFQVCLDCSFESQLTDREICSLAKQLRYCYSCNRKNPHPCLLSLTSLSGQTLSHLKNVSGFEEWSTYAFNPTEQPLEVYYRDLLSDVVYLTSDAETTLEHLDDSKIYCIGGIVDRNRLKGATLKRAQDLGVATAKLPLNQHLKTMDSTHVLTVNHVFEILLKYRQFGRDWKRAMEDVIPQRKHAEFVGVPSTNTHVCEDKNDSE